MKKYKVTYETMKEEHRRVANAPTLFRKTVEIEADSEHSVIAKLDRSCKDKPYFIERLKIEEA